VPGGFTIPAAIESVENGASAETRASAGFPRTGLMAARASADSGDRTSITFTSI